MEKFKIKQFKYSEVWESVHTEMAEIIPEKLKVKRQAYMKTGGNNSKMSHEWATRHKRDLRAYFWMDIKKLIWELLMHLGEWWVDFLPRILNM